MAGAVVLGLGLPAKASLIGDTIDILTVFGACPVAANCLDANVAVVNPGVELAHDDGVSAFASAFASTNFTGSIDIKRETIEVTISVVGVFTFTFSDLDWFEADGVTPLAGTLQNVTPSGNQLTNFTLTDENGTSFEPGENPRVALDCNIGCIPGTAFILNLDVLHDVNGNGVPVPEPSTVTLFGVGLGMLALMVMWRRRSA